jgi:N-acetylglucosamine kinase-like BadF-type ATPase
VTSSIVLAVDGGNSKTDLALVTTAGDVLALVRGPRSTPQYLGVDGCLEVLEHLLQEAAAEAGLNGADRPVAEVAELLLAGVDFADDERELAAAAAARGWAARTNVENDTFAVLRAGTDAGWGVAVVCGSGINCVGVARDGRHTRFPSLGAITGDWGGGYDVGLAAVAAAARSEDGRGPKTSLEQAVPAHFELAAPHELAEAIHRERIQQRRVDELAPIVFAEAEDDDVAREIVERLAGEIAALARVALYRLELTQEPAEVVLGGGFFQSGDGRLVETVRAELAQLGPELEVRASRSAPIVGAALLALDEVGASEEAKARARDRLAAAATPGRTD